LTETGQKAAYQGKGTTDKKERTFTLNFGLLLQKGGVMSMAM
jgi:hypothetical protein